MSRETGIVRIAALGALLGFTAGCGGGGDSGIAEFAAACAKTTNLNDEICECIAEHAVEELTPTAFGFLVASMSGNEEKTVELRGQLGVEDAMQAGMFMTSAPAKCAKQGAE